MGGGACECCETECRRPGDPPPPLPPRKDVFAATIPSLDRIEERAILPGDDGTDEGAAEEPEGIEEREDVKDEFLRV
jgi:hypothetical protein